MPAEAQLGRARYPVHFFGQMTSEIHNDDSRTATCWHEAGHSVVCRLLGAPIKRVYGWPPRVIGGQYVAGIVLREALDFRGKGLKENLEFEMMIALSGPIAERVPCPRTYTNNVFNGVHEGDNEVFWSAAYYYCAMFGQKPAKRETNPEMKTALEEIGRKKIVEDTTAVWRASPSLIPPAVLELRAEITRKTERLLYENWLAIERVASALLARGELSQDQVDEAIAKN